MAAGRIQTKKGGSNTSTVTNVTWDNDTTTGNLIVVVAVLIASGRTFSSITDSQGNTYQRAAQAASGSVRVEIWYAENITGGTTPTVTVNIAGGSSQNNVIIREYSGIVHSGSLDKNAGAVSAGGSANSGNTLATTQDLELVVGGLGSISDPDVGAGYGNYDEQLSSGSSFRAAIEDKDQTTAQVQSAGFTGTASNWGAAVATFKLLVPTASFTADGIIAVRINFLRDPSFEYDDVGATTPPDTITGWRTYADNTGVDYYGVANDYASRGSKSFKIASSGGSVDKGMIATFSNFDDNPGYSLFGFNSGDVITVSGHIKTDGNVVNASITLRDNVGNSTPGSAGANADGRFSTSFTVDPSNNGYIDLVIGLGAYGSSSPGTVWFDELLVEISSSPREYFDGDYRGVWEGTPGESFSYLISDLATKTFTIDGIIKTNFTKTFTVDGVIQASATKTFTIDGIIKASTTKTFTVDAVIQPTKTFTIDGVIAVAGVTKTFTVDAVILFVPNWAFTVDAVINNIGYFLNNTKLKRPKTLVREFIYEKTDYTALTGKQTRDVSAKKEKWMLGFEHLSKAEAQIIKDIVALNRPVNFHVEGFNFPIIDATVIPFVGSEIYSILGSDYLSSLQLELIEEDD